MKMLQCPVCSVWFTKQGKLHAHFLSYMQDPQHTPYAMNLVRCPKCEVVHETPQGLGRHQKSCKSSKLSCPACTYCHQDKRKLNAHILSKADDADHISHAIQLRMCRCCRMILARPQARSAHERKCFRQHKQGIILEPGTIPSASSASYVDLHDRNHFNTIRQELNCKAWTPGPAFAGHNSQSPCPGHSSLSKPLSPPRFLLASEHLFHSIRVYFESTCQNMLLDAGGILGVQNGAKLDNALCETFDSYCFTATMLRAKGLYVEFGHTISKAFALVKHILRAEHPRTLACFFEVFIHFIQAGLPELTSYFLDFIMRMSATIIKKGHLWGQICQLLGELDPSSLNQAMAQFWECISNTFDSNLGRSCRLAVSVRLDYLKRVYGTTDSLEEERFLRVLLPQFRGSPCATTLRVMLNLAHNLNRQGRHCEAEEIAQDIFKLLKNDDTQGTSEMIESLKIISRSQFDQGNAGAENTMLEAIEMTILLHGPQHPWVLEFTTVLEGWYRSWNQQDRADQLRIQIGNSIKGQDI